METKDIQGFIFKSNQNILYKFKDAMARLENVQISTTVNSHVNDSIIHITSIQKSYWDSKADGSHTHSYAGSVQSGGPAYSAERLTYSQSEEINQYVPVYFKQGLPSACQFGLSASVPSGAVFTDHITTIASTTGSGNAITSISADNGNLTVTKGTTFITNISTSGSGNAVTTASINGSTLTLGKNSTFLLSTTTYAGSTSVGGPANSAKKLEVTTAGSTTQPVYFTGGTPHTISYTISKSVPSNAIFTDHITSISGITGDGNAITNLTADANGILTLVKGESFATSLHYHNYAGSDSEGGPAYSAISLDTRAGNQYQPVYIEQAGGKPSACTFGLSASVPSGAVFTDHITTIASTTGSGNAVTAISANNGNLTVTKGTTFITNISTSGSGNAVTTASINGSTLTLGKNSTFSLSTHTHNYAGASSAGGSANSAKKLDTTAAGNNKVPVYFNNGVPVACAYGLSASVPSNAVFTDHITSVAGSSGTGNAITNITADVNGVLTLVKGGSFSSFDHEHNYAGSSQPDGPANSAKKLDIAYGDKYHPIFVEQNGFPSACQFGLSASVPSGAVFTDTTYQSLPESLSGQSVSLVTTGDKYKWNHFKADLISGKIPVSQLPSYVSDIIECETLADFPNPGQTGKIYVDKSTNKTYRWTGTQYIEISQSLALGQTSESAFPGDRGVALQNSRITGPASSHVNTILIFGDSTGKSAIDSGFTIGKSVPADAKFTDTTYISRSETSGGTSVSLVTTGQKYNWNHKANTSDIKNNTIIINQGNITKGSFTLNQSSNQTITLDNTLSSFIDDTTHRLVTDQQKANWDSKASGDHEHNYAGSSQPDGPANSAKKLDRAYGGQYNPIFVEQNGFPSACQFGLSASVPSGAVFTDHITTIASTTGSGNAVTAISANNGNLTVTKGTTFITNISTSGSGNAVTTASINGSTLTLGKNSTFSLSTHTHNYAGASSAGGSANSAKKLDTTTVGSTTQPVYFTGGTPTVCNYKFESKSAASAGTDLSMVTTGQKYNWNNKSNLQLGTTSTTAAAGDHTHNFAAATAPSGAANQAKKLLTDLDMGDIYKPVYFLDGVPSACSFGLSASVPADAVFDSLDENQQGWFQKSLVTTQQKYNWNHKQEVSTAVTHSASVSVGSTTQPVYVGSNGSVAVIGYTISKSVPSNALFTDHITSISGTVSGTGNAITNITADANGVLTLVKGNSFSLSTHTHSYAGASNAGGSANSAKKLDTAAVGSTTQPVYFTGGTPHTISYTISKSVPSNAVFTDHITSVAGSSGTGNAITNITADANGVLTLVKGGSFSSFDHEHNYAGSSQPDGPANSAKKLDRAYGGQYNPIFVEQNGFPSACQFGLSASVPSGAVFTDHITTIASTTGSGNAVTAISANNGNLTVTKGNSFSLSTHTHNYAGASSAGGSANSAKKLDTTAAGNNKVPVYFNNGVPVACAYGLSASVPSNAVFTDTTYESKTASSGGTAVSLVTTGQKYTWNNKQNASTAVTHGASSAVGSSTTPVYIASNGAATVIGYTISKSVPSNAVFTDHITSIVGTTGSGNAITNITADANGGLSLIKGSSFASSDHEHNYAGADQPGAAANMAKRLTYSDSEEINQYVPVYFKQGLPSACQFGLSASVPSGAVFTDHITTIASTTGSGNAVTAISANNGNLTVTKGTTFITNISTSGSGNAVTTASINGSTLTLGKNSTFLTAADNTTVATLTTLAAGGTVNPDGHYTITLSANTTINAGGVTAGKTGAAQIFINPGSFTFIAGSNLTLVNELQQNKTNYCTLVWYGTSCRMYVIDAW